MAGLEGGNSNNSMVALAAVVGLVIGAFGGITFSGKGTGYLVANEAANMQSTFVKLSGEDKNFIVNVANSQIESLQARFVQNDWCTLSGGTWNLTQTNRQLQVSMDVASQLQQQNADVVQLADGNWIANVVLIAREGCIFPLGRG